MKGLGEIIKGEFINLTVFDSKIPNVVRIVINDIQILETKYVNEAFKIRVFVEDVEIYFLKKGDAYDIAVNRKYYKELPSSKNLSLDQNKIKSLPVFTDFETRTTQDCVILQRNKTTKNYESSFLPKKRKEANSTFQYLVDSTDLYSHNFFYLPTGEPHEEFTLVTFVNNS